jgi:hypothetical protein
VRDDLRDYVIGALGEADGVLLVYETGDLKKGAHTVGVQRQYTGTAGSVEPLPANSPLWDTPNLIITPHAAGGRPLGALDLLAENLNALPTGRPLRNVVEP